MEVTLLTNISHDGKNLTEGTVAEVPEELGRKWVENGSAEASKGAANAPAPLVPETPVEPPAPQVPPVPTPDGTTPEQVQEDLANIEASSTLQKDVPEV